MIILDLSADEFPIWPKVAANNKSFIWCNLHNYGGSRALYGNLSALAIEPLNAQKASPNYFLGTGLTMEAIDQNPVVYEFMTEVGVSDVQLEPHTFVETYAIRRYGIRSEQAIAAWLLLLDNAYSGVENCTSYGGPHCNRRSIITLKPTLYMTQSIDIESTPLVKVWSLLQDSSGLTDAWRYDLVDVGRQVMSNLFLDVYFLWINAYEHKAAHSFNILSATMQKLISDWDTLLATHESYLFGRFTAAARGWATNDEESALYEFNARNQVTLWGPDGQIGPSISLLSIYTYVYYSSFLPLSITLSFSLPFLISLYDFVLPSFSLLFVYEIVAKLV